MKGRKSIPNVIKMAKGTFRPHRAKNTPDPSGKKPYPPSWLNKRAKQIFHQMVRRLSDIGLVDQTFTENFASLVSNIERQQRFSKYLDENGWSYAAKNSRGYECEMTRPEVYYLKEADRRVQSLSVEFGLTPASINKVGAGKKKSKKNEFEDF